MSPRELIIVGGPNGAGKTTFALEEIHRRGGIYLSADALAAEKSPDNPAAAAIDAGRMFIERLGILLSTEPRLIVESTLAGKTLARTIARAKGLGVRVLLKYIFVPSSDFCVKRVRERVLNCGHDVPEADIRRRFSRSIFNFWHTYRQLADEWVVIYNGDEAPMEVAHGAGEQVTVYDTAWFLHFEAMT